MRRTFFGQLALIVGALGLSGTARAQAIDSSVFTSEAQAERYLRQNPTGPQAKAAFLAIVEFQLARRNPGFSRSDIAKGVTLNATGASGRTSQTNQSQPDSDRGGGGDLY